MDIERLASGTDVNFPSSSVFAALLVSSCLVIPASFLCSFSWLRLFGLSLAAFFFGCAACSRIEPASRKDPKENPVNLSAHRPPVFLRDSKVGNPFDDFGVIRNDRRTPS